MTYSYGAIGTKSSFIGSTSSHQKIKSKTADDYYFDGDGGRPSMSSFNESMLILLGGSIIAGLGIWAATRNNQSNYVTVGVPDQQILEEQVHQHQNYPQDDHLNPNPFVPQ